MAALVDTRIDRVIVHPGAAQITRTGTLAVAGPAQVRIAGLPAGLDDDSVQLAMTGPGRAVELRVVVEVVGPDDATAAPDELLAARRTLAAVGAERQALASALAALDGLAPVVPSERDGIRPAWGDVVQARLALVEVARTRAAAVRAELAAVGPRLAAAEQAVAAAEDRLRRRSTAELPPGAITKAVILTVVPDGDGGPCTIRCSYRVSGARWAPTYVARLDDGQVRLELRAAIAQATGEDWRQVEVELSTAEPGRHLELPELAALRIGRAQPRPARAGWRPPPVGLDELYRDYDRAFAALPTPAPRAPWTPPGLGGATTPSSGYGAPPPPPSARPFDAPMPAPDLSSRSMSDDDDDDAMVASFDEGGDGGVIMADIGGPPGGGRGGGGGAMPMFSAQAPAAAKSSAPFRGRGPVDAKKMVNKLSAAGAARRAAPEEAKADDDDAIVARVDLLAFAQLTLASPREPGRGTLRRQHDHRRWDTAPETAAQIAGAAGAAYQRVARLSLPAGLRAPASGVYDYAFASDGRLDVPADGTWHQVAVSARTAPVTIAHVATPAVAPEVYRVATLTNPLDAPLLAGPVDVYERGELVITAALDETAPGGAVALGLGVDPAVKTARNARYREETAGVLRGSLRLVHDVTVDVENLGPRPIELEIRERVPIPAAGVDDIEVTLDRAVPPWEPWRPEPRPGEAALKGGHRWRVALAPGQRQALRVEYAIKIAGKHELVGGNRREP